MAAEVDIVTADTDSLDALRPPLDETEEKKAVRLAQEAEARRISQEIDESIRQEHARQKKGKIVRVLLLGQSESGERHFIKLPCPIIPTQIMQ
jgi:guanine nucleotide-binding protein alpha-1 subunit